MQSSLLLARISSWTNNLGVGKDFYVCISMVSVIGDVSTLTPLHTWVVTVSWWFMYAAGSRAGPMMPAACIVTGYCLGISESASFTALTSHEHQPVPRQLVKNIKTLHYWSVVRRDRCTPVDSLTQVSNTENVSMMWRIMLYLIKPNIYISFLLWHKWLVMNWLRPYVVGSRSNGIGHEFVLP